MKKFDHMRSSALRQCYDMEDNPLKTFETLEKIKQIFSKGEWKDDPIAAYEKLSDLNIDLLMWRMDSKEKIHEMYLKELEDQGATEEDILRSQILAMQA
jgi:hypothetical protein